MNPLDLGEEGDEEQKERERNWYPELDIHPDEGGLPLPENPMITHSMATLIALGESQTLQMNGLNDVTDTHARQSRVVFSDYSAPCQDPFTQQFVTDSSNDGEEEKSSAIWPP